MTSVLLKARLDQVKDMARAQRYDEALESLTQLAARNPDSLRVAATRAFVDAYRNFPPAAMGEGQCLLPAPQ